MRNAVRRRGARAPVVIEPLESRSLLSAVAGHHPLHALRHLTAHGDIRPQPLAASGTPSGLTPAQVRHAYGFDKIFFGNGSVAGDGTGQTIAIVDAYDDPNIVSDLDVFNSQFGLPAMDGRNGHPSFTVISASHGKVRSDAGWALEISLDVEWAHAIAPMANIVLVEAKTNSFTDLLAAVDVARSRAGVSVVSMSWGGGEFSSETSYDYYFTTPSGHSNVSFVASSGDSGAPLQWPAASPNILSVGGTTLNVDASGNYLSESTWSGSTGGISAYESKPSYQSSITLSRTRRSGPDVSYDADPKTGFSVYDSFGYQGQSGWFKLGGTSAGAPQWAALVAIADQGRSLQGKRPLDGRSQLLPAVYAATTSSFFDVTTGSSSGSPSYSATTGYDLATGKGSPHADSIASQLLTV